MTAGPAQVLGVEVRRLEEKEVYVPLPGHRPGGVEEPAPGQQGEPEEHQPGRKVEDQITLGHPLQQLGPPLRGARLAHLVAHLTPEMGLPQCGFGQPAPGSVDVLAGRPGPDHGRSVQVVAVEQVGHPAGLRVAGRTRCQPVERSQSGVGRRPSGDGQHRPDQAVDSPGIAFGIAPVGREHRAPEGPWVGADDVGGDAVTATGAAGAQATGQLEHEPSPHPIGGDGQPLRRHRIGRRLLEDAGYSAGQGERPVGRIEVDHDQGPYSGAATPTEWASQRVPGHRHQRISGVEVVSRMSRSVHRAHRFQRGNHGKSVGHHLQHDRLR